MSTIADSDYFLINRGGSSYKITAADVKSELGGGSYDGEGRFDTPVQVLTPVNGAGLTTSSTYQPFTPPSLRDLNPSNYAVFQPEFNSAADYAGIVQPVTQCGPDGKDYQSQIGEVLSVTKTDFTSKLKYTGNIIEGEPKNVFDGSSGTQFKLGPDCEFDFTDCNLPVAFMEMIWWYGFSSTNSACYVQATYSDGTVADIGWGKASSNDSISPIGKAILKLKMVGGNSTSYLSIVGMRPDAGNGGIGTPNGNWIRDGMWQLNFAPGSETQYSIYGQFLQPHNEQVAFAGYKRDSIVLWTPNATSPNPTSFVAGDNVVGPVLSAYAATVQPSQSGSIQLSNCTGQWFVGLCVKGAPITASAPSAQSVEFTSANFNTTPVTGTNVSLTNRRWSLESSPNEGGPWTVVGTYDDDSANFSQNGSDKWEGKPTLQGNTYYRVKVRYDSANAPSEESTQSIFKTA